MCKHYCNWIKINPVSNSHRTTAVVATTKKGLHSFFPLARQDEVREVLCMLVDSISGARNDVCPKRCESVSILPVKMSEELQHETKPTKTALDESVSQSIGQGVGRGLDVFIRETSQSCREI